MSNLPNPSLKRCTTSNLDRLSSLPDELLIHILLLLPTKDAAATCVLNRRLIRVFPLLTSLDLDASSICFCKRCRSGTQQLPSFVAFVDAVLGGSQCPYLTKFRVQIGLDYFDRRRWGCHTRELGSSDCFPDVKPARISAWMSFPFTRSGLRELDVCIRSRGESGPDDQLPPAIFQCQTLEVLKLDVDLGFDQASALPSFCLPNLKLLYLCVFFSWEDEFLMSLVSSCPVLEDLTLKLRAMRDHVEYTCISSPSLRRLCYQMMKSDLFGSTDLVIINTPNLEFLDYDDNLAFEHSITNMDRLQKARVYMGNTLLDETHEVRCQQMSGFMRPLSNVQHLYISGTCAEDLNHVEAKDQLPWFCNLKHLELGNDNFTYWNHVLLAFLYRSPVLETLVFPEGNLRQPYTCAARTRVLQHNSSNNSML